MTEGLETDQAVARYRGYLHAPSRPRLEDPSLPPVVHDWARRSRSTSLPAIVRRAAKSRWSRPALLLFLGAAMAFEAMRFFSPQAGPGRDSRRDDRIGSPPTTGTAKEARAPDADLPPAFLPPGAPVADLDESRLVQVYRQSFLDKQYDFRRLRIDAPGGATNLVRPDPRGLRITIPAQFGQPVAIETKFGIHGDFDLRAAYEILGSSTPATGFGVGPELLVKPPGDWDKSASLSRFARPKDNVYSAAFVIKVDNKTRVRGNWPATSTQKGTFRLVRTGPLLHYLVAEGDKAEFRQIYEVEFGDEDLEMARIAAHTGGSMAAVDVLWKDIEIRAEALPGLPSTPTATTGLSPWLVLAIAVAVAVLGGVAVWTLAVFQRRNGSGKPQTRRNRDGERVQ